MTISADDIRPMVQDVVDVALERLRATEARLAGPERLGYTEREAAALIGVPPHRLRDARLRGEITGRKVGKATVYSREQLMRFLNGETAAAR